MMPPGEALPGKEGGEGRPEEKGAPGALKGGPDSEGREGREAGESPVLGEGREEEPREQAYFVTLRYGRMRHRGTFLAKDPDLSPGSWVLARTPRGVEPGLVISLPRTQPLPTRGGIPEEDQQPAGEVLRRLQPGEAKPPWEETGRFSTFFFVGQEMIRSLGLPMKLTDVEVLPRREKAVFYFLADGRVDFRQLVRNLARALKIRVEMKQIGVRDEARLKGTCGHCGLPLCCTSWIRKMAPVNMKMAKTQKTTLDPDKISGRCGRLLCCLRYEEETYKENRKSLPPRNSWVETPQGTGRVVAQEVLMCRVRVVLASGEVQVFPLEEVKPVPPPRPGEGGGQAGRAQAGAGGGGAGKAKETRPSARGAREGKEGPAGPAGGTSPQEGKKESRKKKGRRRRRPGKGGGPRKRPSQPPQD